MDKLEKMVGRAVAGDQKAMHWLYRRHVDAAWQLAFRILQRRDLAQDCTQEAFVKAFASLGSLDDHQRFSGWLIRIVHRKALDHHRREQRHQARSLDETEMSETSNDDFLLKRRLMDAIDSLDRGIRDVVIHFYLLGNKHAEIANALNISEGSSKRKLFEAREQMRVLLKDVVQI